MTLSEIRAKNREYYEAYRSGKIFVNIEKPKPRNKGGVRAFENCKDCRTCEKLDCRHNHNEEKSDCI